MNRKYIEIIIVSVAMAIMIAWFFKDAIFSNQIFVERDLSRYYYPLRELAVNFIKSGIFPLWNPYIFCGNPLFATLQSSILYPLSIIYYIGNFANVFNIFIVVHFFLAAIFTYLFSKEMHYSPIASFLSAASFCFSGYLVSTVNLLTTLSVVAWLPLATLFYYRMIKAARYNFGDRFNGIPTQKNKPVPADSDSKPVPAERKEAVILGIIFTVMFLGGEPSVLYLIIGLFFAGSVYFTVEKIVEDAQTPRGPEARLPNFNYIKYMLLAIVVFLGLSAFQLLPFWEFLKASSRQTVSFHMASIWNLPIKDIPSIIWPFFHDIFKLFEDYWLRQSWLDNYYVGVIVFILFIVGILFDRSKRARAIFVFGLLGFFIALGKDTILFNILYNFMPGFKAVRYSIRFFFIPAFAISVLAGAGLDYYIKFAKKDHRLERLAFLILALAFLASICFWVLDFNFSQAIDFVKSYVVKLMWQTSLPKAYVQDILGNPDYILKFICADLINLKRAFLLIAIFGCLFYLGTKKEVRTIIFVVPVLALLAILDVAQVNNGYNPLCDIKKFVSPTSNIEYLAKERSRLKALYPGDFNKQLFRICCSPQTAKEHAYVPEADFFKGLEVSKDRLITNRMIAYGIYDVNMYGSVYLKRNSRFMKIIMEKKSKNLEKLLALANVRFVASSKEPKAVGFKLANKAEAASLYETIDYLPRAFLTEKAVIIKDEDAIIAKLREGDFQPAKEVILEEYTSRGPEIQKPRSPDTQRPSGDSVRIVSYGPNKVIMEAHVDKRPKILIFTDTYYPGWKVFVDGQKRKLLRADYIFRAVHLEPGMHTVAFVYSPLSFKLGLIITILTSLIVLTIIMLHIIIK